MPTIDVYCRTAFDDHRAQASLQRQEDACRTYCGVYGLTIGQVMHEVAPGTAYKGRPVFDLIRARYQNHLIDGIIVATIECLTERPDQLFFLLEELDHYGVTLYCATMEPNDHFWVWQYRESRKG